MPGSITHCLFAHDCLTKLNNADIQNILKNNIEVYLLGCQGPNFFSYYNYLPFLSNQNLSILNDNIHSSHINDFFESMISYSNNTSTIRYIFNNSNFRDITLAYLYGYFSHYVLDTYTHPFIYNLEFRLHNQYKSQNSKALHKSIETHIDKLLLNKFKNITPNEYNDYHKTKLNADQLIIICDMYTFLIKKIFNKSVPYNDICKCLKMFERTEKNLNKNNIYSKGYLKLKGLISKTSNVESKIYINHSHCVNDLLNTNNSSWIDPFTNIKYSTSFIDIYNYSLEFYIELMDILYLYLNNKKTMLDLLSKINDNSYLTNQNWKVNNIKY